MKERRRDRERVRGEKYKGGEEERYGMGERKRERERMRGRNVVVGEREKERE